MTAPSEAAFVSLLAYLARIVHLDHLGDWWLALNAARISPGLSRNEVATLIKAYRARKRELLKAQNAAQEEAA